MKKKKSSAGRPKQEEHLNIIAVHLSNKEKELLQKFARGINSSMSYQARKAINELLLKFGISTEGKYGN